MNDKVGWKLVNTGQRQVISQFSSIIIHSKMKGLMLHELELQQPKQEEIPTGPFRGHSPEKTSTH